MQQNFFTKIFGRYAWLALSGSIFFIDGCGEFVDSDPCKNREPIQALFTMGELMPHWDGRYKGTLNDTIILSDTVLTNNTIVFEARGGFYDSFEWKIGDDPRVFTGKKIFLNFPNPEPRLQIKLTVKGTPNTACFPDDDGEDTLIKELTVLNKDSSPVVGIYKGSLVSDPGNIFNVEVSQPVVLGSLDYKISNLQNGCNPSIAQFLDIIAYKTLAFDGHGTLYNGCQDERGYLTLAKNGKDVTIKFSASVPGTTSFERQKLIFNGRKID